MSWMIAFPVVWFIVNMFFATSRPRPLNLEPLRFLFVSTLRASIRFGRWTQQFFSGNIKPVPHFKANNCTTFAKKLIPGRSLRSSFIDPFRLAKKRCTSQGFGALNSCVDWSEGFPNMVLRKMNIYEHRTRVARFNSFMSFWNYVIKASTPPRPWSWVKLVNFMFFSFCQP